MELWWVWNLDSYIEGSNGNGQEDESVEGFEEDEEKEIRKRVIIGSRPDLKSGGGSNTAPWGFKSLRFRQKKL